jgi:hypothetical protein
VDFENALIALKAGSRLARSSWNAAGQFVVLQAGYPDGIAINQNTATATGLPLGSVQRFRPYLMLWTAQGDFVPWAPTVSDVLAEDWDLVRAFSSPPSTSFADRVHANFTGKAPA